MHPTTKSKRIKELREYLGLSKCAFAKKISLSHTHLTRLESGIVEPSDAIIDNICDIFGVEKDYFYTSALGQDIPSDWQGNPSDNPSDVTPAAVSIADYITNEAQHQVEMTKLAGQRIKSARLEKDLTLYDLADMVGVNESTLSRLERSESVSEKIAVQVADALEVGVDWILYGDEEKKNYPADARLIDWLWAHEDVRKNLWRRMTDSK